MVGCMQIQYMLIQLKAGLDRIHWPRAVGGLEPPVFPKSLNPVSITIESSCDQAAPSLYIFYVFCLRLFFSALHFISRVYPTPLSSDISKLRWQPWLPLHPSQSRLKKSRQSSKQRLREGPCAITATALLCIFVLPMIIHMPKRMKSRSRIFVNSCDFLHPNVMSLRKTILPRDSLCGQR